MALVFKHLPGLHDQKLHGHRGLFSKLEADGKIETADLLKVFFDRQDPTDAVATAFDLNTVRDKDIAGAREYIKARTREFLDAEFPGSDTITVYRGGRWQPNEPVAVTTKRSTAEFFSGQRDQPVREWTVSKDDVLYATKAFKSILSFEGEEELGVYPETLDLSKAAPFKEDLHPRDRKGRFARKRLRRIAAALRANDTIPDDFYWDPLSRPEAKKGINARLTDELLKRAETDPKLAEALDHFTDNLQAEQWEDFKLPEDGSWRAEAARHVVRSVIDGWASSAYKSPSSWLVQQRARRIFDVPGIEQDPRFMSPEERKKHWVGTMEDPEELDPMGQRPYPEVVADFLYSAGLINTTNQRQEMGWTDGELKAFDGRKFVVDQATIDMREGNISAAETILDAIVEQVYEDTQKMFKDKNIEAVELHRGTDSQYVRDASTPPLGVIDDPGALHDIAVAFHEWEAKYDAYDDAMEAKTRQEDRNNLNRQLLSEALFRLDTRQDRPTSITSVTSSPHAWIDVSPEEERAWRMVYDPDEDGLFYERKLGYWLTRTISQSIGSDTDDTSAVIGAWVKHAVRGDKLNDFDLSTDDTPLPGLKDRFPYDIPREQRKLLYGTIERLFDGDRTPDGDVLKSRLETYIAGTDEWSTLNILYSNASDEETNARHHFEYTINDIVGLDTLWKIPERSPTPGHAIVTNLKMDRDKPSDLVPGERYARDRIKAFGEDLDRATKIEIPDTSHLGFGAVLQPLSSFSTNADATGTFGQLKLSATVPVERIWSTALTGPGCLSNEQEMIIIGGETDLDVTGGSNEIPPVSVQTGLFESSWAAPELLKAAQPLALLDLYECDWIKEVSPDITWPYEISKLDSSFRYRSLLEKGDKPGHPFRGNQSPLIEKKAPKPDPEKYLAQEAMDAAIRYAEENAGKLITGKVKGKLSKTQQAAIRTNIKRAIARGEDIDKASARVKRLVGLSERDALAVDNYERYLRRREVKDSTVNKAVKDYERRLHNRRARLIAGQEIAKAVAEGKREVWKAAQDEGTLSHKARRIFHIHPDEKTCGPCRKFAGQHPKGVPLDSPEGPPLHVQCRCWETLEDPNPLPAHKFYGNQHVTLEKGDRKGHPFRGNQWKKVLSFLDLPEIRMIHEPGEPSVWDDRRLVIPDGGDAGELHSRKLEWQLGSTGGSKYGGGGDRDAVMAIDNELMKATDSEVWNRDKLNAAVRGEGDPALVRGVELQRAWTRAAWDRMGLPERIPVVRAVRRDEGNAQPEDGAVTSWVVKENQQQVADWYERRGTQVDWVEATVTKDDVLAIPWAEGRLRSDFVRIKGEVLVIGKPDLHPQPL